MPNQLAQATDNLSSLALLYSPLFKLSYLLLAIPTILVIISAVISSKSIGGTLGHGMKKIAVGSVIDTILLWTYLMLESGSRGVLNETQVRIFFATSGLFASTLLIAGYMQVYSIAKRLKLFTP